MLDELGCDVVTASTGRRALELLSTHQRIELLITDVNMPVMGGRKLVERAKRLWKELRVILLSRAGDRRPRIPAYSKAFPGTGSRKHDEAHNRPMLTILTLSDLTAHS